jgi:DMSO/TMAO reductase YedYZ molybdopterin-dependent catalytic subunit
MIRLLSRRGLIAGAAGFLPRGLRGQQTDLTPADQIFVRNHFTDFDPAKTGLTLASWSLRIDGRVARPITLSFSDLLESTLVKQEALLECAGNGESGTAVAMCQWEGVQLGRLLDLAGAKRDSNILLEGYDRGTLVAGSAPANYTRVVPAQKCFAPESLLAIRLNDRFLPARNGFPARVILPGRYGMDSVKWIRRISVLAPGDNVPASYVQSGMPRLYSRLTKKQPPVPVSAILVKSVIGYPSADTKTVASTVPVSGYAWTGDSTIKEVRVSVDGGRNWDRAQFSNSPKAFHWVQWTYNWSASSGNHILMSRAEDSAGRLQPMSRDPERMDAYELNTVAPVSCTVL